MVELILSRDLRAQGFDTRSLETGARRGGFVRVRPGAYAVAAEWHTASAEERHRARMSALVATSRRTPVFSHESAALLHGIPLVDELPETPHVVGSDVGHRAPGGVRVHRPRHPWPLGEIDGASATTPACTAINLAATRSLRAGVAALDRVIANGVTRDWLADCVHAWKPFHGSRRVERALSLATGLAETALESVSLVAIHLGGLEQPEQQFEVVARGNRYRLDFAWPRHRVVGEADGRRKYRTAEDLWREKQREDAIRSLGWGFARWGWEEAVAGGPVVSRLLDAGLRVGAPRA